MAGSPALRRGGARPRSPASARPAYAADLATYGRALQQRNGLLRRDPRGAGDPGRAAVLGRRPARVRRRGRRGAARGCSTRSRSRSPRPTPRSRRTRPPGRLRVTYATNAPQLPGESVRTPSTRRLAETAEKEVWNGTTLVGPHRDDLVFELGGRDLAAFASRGQQRTAILAFKLAELDLLTALDGRPPLLLLDDVFSELDPERRAHLVRRIAALPQAFVTTTTLDDLDPALRAGRRPAGPSRPGGRRAARLDRGTCRRTPDDLAATADGADRRPAAGRRAGPRARGRAPPGPRDATWDALVAERVPPPSARAGSSGSSATRSSSRPTSRSWRRSCACAPTSCWGRSRRPRRRSGPSALRGSGCPTALTGRPAMRGSWRSRTGRPRGAHDPAEPACPIPAADGTQRPSERVAHAMRLDPWPSVSS